MPNCLTTKIGGWFKITTATLPYYKYKRQHVMSGQFKDDQVDVLRHGRVDWKRYKLQTLGMGVSVPSDCREKHSYENASNLHT